MKSPAQLFTPKDLQRMKEEFILLKSRYERLLLMTTGVVNLLKKSKAKEYMMHGVGRRLGIIERCVENIFLIFPVDKDTLLNWDERRDIAINLHAFFVNIFGLLDNLAWVLVYENGKADKIKRRQVSLFNNEIKDIAPSTFRDYLNAGHLQKWHDEYLKDYRDTLAHRIPPYLPPKTLTPEQQQHLEAIQSALNEQFKLRDFDAINKLQDEEDCVGDPCPAFLHDVEESKAVLLHPQVITDFKTVEEVIEKFCAGFDVSDRGK